MCWLWVTCVAPPARVVGSFSSVYVFIAQSYLRRQRLWPSVRREWCWVAGLLPLVASNWSAPLVRSLKSLLSPLLEDAGSRSSLWTPLDVLRSGQRCAFAARRWRCRPGIVQFEGHAFLWGVRWRARQISFQEARWVFLGDNIAQVGASVKGRAAEWGLLAPCWELGALFAATGSRVYFCWIPSPWAWRSRVAAFFRTVKRMKPSANLVASKNLSQKTMKMQTRQ